MKTDKKKLDRKTIYPEHITALHNTKCDLQRLADTMSNKPSFFFRYGGLVGLYYCCFRFIFCLD